jgi:hypothetical protein
VLAAILMGFAPRVHALPILAVDADLVAPGLQGAREVEPGSTFEVAVLSSAVDDLHGFELDLRFDALAFTAISVQDGGALGAAALVLEQDLVPPEVALTVLRSGGAGVDLGDDSVLAIVAFEARMQPGFYALDLNDVILSAPGGVPIGTEALLDATIRVVPEPHAALLVGCGLLSLAWRARRS